MYRAIGLLLTPLLALSSTATPPTSAQTPQPSDYFPLPDELPRGFVLLPNGETPFDGPGVVGVFREYARSYPVLAPDGVTGLTLGVALAGSVERAREVYSVFVRAMEDTGFAGEPLDGVIGEEATVTRRLVDPQAERPSQELAITFRVGAVTVVVQWHDYADLLNYDHAFAVAQVMEARASANPMPTLAPPGMTAPSPPPPSAPPPSPQPD